MIYWSWTELSSTVFGTYSSSCVSSCLHLCLPLVSEVCINRILSLGSRTHKNKSLLSLLPFILLRLPRLAANAFYQKLGKGNVQEQSTSRPPSLHARHLTSLGASYLSLTSTLGYIHASTHRTLPLYAETWFAKSYIICEGYEGKGGCFLCWDISHIGKKSLCSSQSTPVF